MLLSAENIYKNYGMKQLLKGVSLYLNEGEKIGIIGVNGTGKSTLLRILAGTEPQDEGTVSINSGLKTVFLPQNPEMQEDYSILEQIFHGFSAQYREENTYKAKTMLTKLGIFDFDAKISTLSGGQRKRVALAEVLMQPSDILILDEPTNHLDSQMVMWLEQYLSRFTGGLIMITHDRYFLERVSNKIVELWEGNLYTFEANYSKYLELKAQREEMAQASERKRQSILRKEYQWIMRGARARGTKSRERIERYENLRDMDSPTANENVQVATIASRLGKKIIEVENISKSFDGKKIIDDFSYMISRDDRIGIVGQNGAGKSTLLNLITGKLQSDSGKIDIGQTVKIGYFMQESHELPSEMRVIDYITEVSREIKTSEGTFSASQMLERFLFSGDIQYSTIGRLSGGEKRRLYLLGILMAAPNILILDEPTNDLDIETLSILEDYFESFPGAVLTVSHDRFFLDKIANTIFEVGDEGHISVFLGNFSDYHEVKQAEINEKSDKSDKKSQDKAPKSNRNQDNSRPQKLKFSFKEQREFETIDEDIAKIEEEISSCELEISKTSSDYVKLQELTQTKEALEKKLEEKTERWLYLNDLDEKIKAQTNQ